MDLTWDEFLHGYALPFSDQRVDPLNQQRAILGSLQEQANLVSAFALVVGLDQSKTKFRAFRFPLLSL